MSFFTSTSNLTAYHKLTVLKFFISIVILVFLAASISFVVDVEGIYLKKYLADRQLSLYVSEMVTADHGVVYSSNERAVKYKLASTSSTDCYALGSSRAMQISLRDKSWISSKCASLANLGVSGGTLEDVAIYSSIIVNRNRAKVFLVVDPWMLKFNSDLRWMEFEDDFNAFFSDIGDKTKVGSDGNFMFEKAKNLINYDYVRVSFESVLDDGWSAFPDFNSPAIDVVNDFDWREGYSQPVTLSDGSHVYANSYISGAKDRDVDNGRYRNYRLAHYEVEKAASNFFYSLIQNVSAKHDLYLVLNPFHPAGFSEDNQEFVVKVDYVEREVRNMANQLGIPVLGSYRPELVGCNKQDYLDSIHPVFSCIENLGSKWFE